MTTDEAKEVHYQGVVYGIPTFGRPSINFQICQNTIVTPIFVNVGYHHVQGKPVDVARNEIAWTAQRNGTGYVFFRDDDTIVPPDALQKLLARFPKDEVCNPKEKASMVVGGVVYSKTKPPTPMIYSEGGTGGFEDWQPGDLIKCDVIGMGATIIPIGVFDKLMPHIKWWGCVNHSCEVNWTVEYEEEGNCPHCNFPLVPKWFKTVRGGTDEWNGMMSMTEDAYFLLKCKKAGIHVYADAGVLCKHEVFNANPDLTEYYYYNEALRMPCWQVGDLVHYYSDAKTGEPDFVKASEKKERAKLPQIPDPLKFDLGSGGQRIEGYVSVDLYTEADFKCDIRDITPAVKRYGRPREIRASHVLEHIDRNNVHGTLRNWLVNLAPGGVVNFEVPDGLAAAKAFVEVQENGGDLNGHKIDPEMVLMGAQRYQGDEHRVAFTERKINDLLDSCSTLIHDRKVEVLFPEENNQQVIRVRVTKKEADENVPEVVR